MVEISLSGSGEGPGRVTSRPTLQRYFYLGGDGSAPPEPRRLDAAASLCPTACACKAARWLWRAASAMADAAPSAWPAFSSLKFFLYYCTYVQYSQASFPSPPSP